MDDPEDTETRLWRDAVAALLAKGATPTEAFDGANLLLAAFKRERVRKPMPQGE